MFRPVGYEQLEPRLLMSADALELGAISGRVFLVDDQQTPTPLPGVALVLRDEVGQPVAAAATDQHGSYLFDQLAPGIYAIDQTQPVGLADRGVAIGDGGGQQLADNLIGEIYLASGASHAGYDFYEGLLNEIDPGEPPPLVAHGSSDGQNAFWSLALPAPLISGPAAGQSELPPAGPTQLPERGVLSADRQPSVDPSFDPIADIATRAARRRAADDSRLLETVVSAAKGELLIDGAVQAARWLEDLWDDFSTWLPDRPADEQSAPATHDDAPLVARQKIEEPSAISTAEAATGDGPSKAAERASEPIVMEEQDPRLAAARQRDS